MREVRCDWLGRDAVVFESGGELSQGVQRRIWRMMRAAPAWPGVNDVTAGLQNLTLYLDPSRPRRETYERLLLDAWRQSETEAAVDDVSPVEIHVRYGGSDGPDLAHVARAHGIRESDVVERHCAGDYVASFLGFAPGFAYLSGLDPALHTPRRSVPRTRVPAGSVAIGGELTGVYPSALPGGWNLIGRTERILFDPARDPAALLAPGDRVRFVALR